MAAWCGVGLVNAIAIATLLPMPKRGIEVRAVHHFYDLGHMIALGLLAAGGVGAWERWGPGRGQSSSKWRSRLRTAAGWGLLAAVSIGPGFYLLWEDLFGLAQRTGTVLPPSVLHPIAIVGVALGVPAAALVGRILARFGWLRAVGLAGALAAVIANHRLLRNDYPGAHFYLAAAAAALATASAAGARLPWRRRSPKQASTPEGAAPEAPPKPRSALRSVAAWALVGMLAVWGALSLVVPPKRAVLLELQKTSGSVLSPFLVPALPAVSAANVEVPAEAREWFEARSRGKRIPPSSPPLLPRDGIIVLLTIDAVRADVLRKAENAPKLPTLTALQRESVDFTLARSPGSQTVYSLTTLFSGTYFSQQYWTAIKDLKDNYTWPHDDPHQRFPELLTKAGIPTVNHAAATWMRNKWGVVRGFSEEQWFESDLKFSKAFYLGDATVARIREHEGGPLFLYMHFFDPHEPYDRAITSGSANDRYVAEIGLVDAEIKRILDALDEKGFKDRSVVIVTADHGEAFGEHRTNSHSTTLYEEQLRVPLLIRGPGMKPRQVDHPVSLVDLGPTVLDLMGIPTPPQFMGQSLVPFLRGEDPVLTRPIVAEGRLKRTMLFPDGLKAITDERKGTVEVYDLLEDPAEARNLYDEEDETAERVAILQKFFEVHKIKRRGYTIPYRK